MFIDMSFNPSGMKLIGQNIMVHNYVLIQKCGEIPKVDQNQVEFVMKWILGREANQSVVDYVGMKAITEKIALIKSAHRGKVRIIDYHFQFHYINVIFFNDMQL